MLDKDEFVLQDANIVIIGLGLMGGSLALSLKGNCRNLCAIDNHTPTVELARRNEIVHRASIDPLDILPDVDLVILACPVPDIIDWLKKLPDYVQKPCVVLDIGSSKRAIVEAMESLPTRFDPLGGHAICGRERLSLENAERLLYNKAPFVFTPLPRTNHKARSAAKQIVELLGAFPIWVDAETHDRILASTSHLPFLLSSALTLVTPEEAIPFIGPGFLSSTRLASTPSSMMFGVLRTNRDYTIAAISRLQEQLSELETVLLADDSDQLVSFLDAASSHYGTLVRDGFSQYES